MRTRITTAVAAFAFTAALGVLAAPAASAGPIGIEPTPVEGSVGICFIIPLGSAEIPICF